MVIKVLSAELKCIIDIGSVAPTIDICIWNIKKLKIIKPVYVVYCLNVFTIVIRSMDSHNTNKK